MLNCIDNSGAAVVECVKVYRMKRHAKIGTEMKSLADYHCAGADLNLQAT